MSQKRKLKIERTLADAVAAIFSCDDVSVLTDNNRTCIQILTIQQYNRR